MGLFKSGHRLQSLARKITPLKLLNSCIPITLTKHILLSYIINNEPGHNIKYFDWWSQSVQICIKLNMEWQQLGF
jgi:hypothetical protein